MASKEELEAAERAFTKAGSGGARVDPAILPRKTALRQMLDAEMLRAVGSQERRRVEAALEAMGADASRAVAVEVDAPPSTGASPEGRLRTQAELYNPHGRVYPGLFARDPVDYDAVAKRLEEAVTPGSGLDALARTARRVPKHLRNLIPLGIMAKILGAGTAKAAGPAAEALLFAGHEKPNIREALAADADMVAGAMGLPTGYQNPTAINREDAATLEAAIEGARRRGIDIRGKASYRAAYPEGVRADPDSSPLSPEQLENYLALRAEAARGGRTMGTPREIRPTVEVTGRQ